MAFVLCGAIVSGCLGESAYPAYTYRVEITGLANFTNDNTTTLLIPVPVMNDKPLFYAAGVLSQSDDWSVMLADTAYGKMLSLTTNETNLSDVSFDYTEIILTDQPFDRHAEIMNRSREAPLCPVSNDTPTYTVSQESPGVYSALTYHAVKNYSSLVCVDNNIRPVAGSNNTIEISLQYSLYRGMDRSNGRGEDWAGIHEIIPAGVTGYMPVNTCLWSTVG